MKNKMKMKKQIKKNLVMKISFFYYKSNLIYLKKPPNEECYKWYRKGVHEGFHYAHKMMGKKHHRHCHRHCSPFGWRRSHSNSPPSRPPPPRISSWWDEFDPHDFKHWMKRRCHHHHHDRSASPPPPHFKHHWHSPRRCESESYSDEDRFRQFRRPHFSDEKWDMPHHRRWHSPPPFGHHHPPPPGYYPPLDNYYDEEPRYDYYRGRFGRRKGDYPPPPF